MFELTDYQVVALLLLGFSLGAYVMLIIDDRRAHPDWTWKAFVRYEWRILNGHTCDREVRSQPHTID